MILIFQIVADSICIWNKKKKKKKRSGNKEEIKWSLSKRVNSSN